MNKTHYNKSGPSGELYGSFVWWQGVVEDKMDPLYLGRCRVRILGYHTDDKDKIPTEDLPWAMPMQPITSAAMSGVGTTPLGPVEGTWVIGFFRDGENAQEPVIMGTIGGKPEEGPDPARGFNDPFGKYPLSDYIARYQTNTDGTEKRDEDGLRTIEKSGEPDTNRLARGNLIMPLGTENGENSASLAWKRKTRQKGVPKALAGDVSSSIGDTADPFYPGGADGDADNFNYYWNEPNPRYGGTTTNDTKFETSYSSCYPHNHVKQSEAGHVEEWDDTPSAERLHRYHSSGTFEEIQADGTRVVKITGADYEIVAGEKNISVSGDCNITVTGNCRLLSMGNMVQEVRGDYHLNVARDMRVKVGGSMVQEISDQRKIKVGKNDDLFVAVSQVHNIGKNCEIQVGADYAQSAGANWTCIAPTVGITGTKSTIVMGITTCDIMGATVGLSSALLTKIGSDTKIWVNGPWETHTVGKYDCTTLTTWSVNATGIFSLKGAVAGSVAAGAKLKISAGAAMTISAVGAIKATASQIYLN